jgi:hypothetical protein
MARLQMTPRWPVDRFPAAHRASGMGGMAYAVQRVTQYIAPPQAWQ